MERTDINKKTYKQIKEDWVGSAGFRASAPTAQSDIFKNPSPSEMKDLIRSAKTSFGGVLHDRDIYVFDGDRAYHENVMDELGISESPTTFKFRFEISGGKLVNFEEGANSLGMSVSKGFPIVVANRYIKPYLHPDPDKVLGHIKRYDRMLYRKLSPAVVSEEWVDKTYQLGDVYKNPTPKELAEYAKGLQISYDMAGVLHKKKDLYVFSSGLHMELLRRFELNWSDSILFRGVIGRSGKIERITPSGGGVDIETPSQRKKVLGDAVALANHPIIKRARSGVSVKEFMEYYIGLFDTVYAPDELDAALKKIK